MTRWGKWWLFSRCTAPLKDHSFSHRGSMENGCIWKVTIWSTTIGDTAVFQLNHDCGRKDQISKGVPQNEHLRDDPHDFFGEVQLQNSKKTPKMLMFAQCLAHLFWVAKSPIFWSNLKIVDERWRFHPGKGTPSHMLRSFFISIFVSFQGRFPVEELWIYRINCWSFVA